VHEQEKIWESVKRTNFNEFWEVNCKLNDRSLENIPVRICYPNKPSLLRSIPTTGNEESEHTLLSMLQDILQDKFNPGQLKIVIQGICVPYDTSLIWLSQHCCHPDGFLYICIL
jgi:hypothetical protein